MPEIQEEEMDMREDIDSVDYMERYDSRMSPIPTTCLACSEHYRVGECEGEKYGRCERLG